MVAILYNSLIKITPTRVLASAIALALERLLVLLSTLSIFSLPTNKIQALFSHFTPMNSSNLLFSRRISCFSWVAHGACPPAKIPRGYCRHKSYKAIRNKLTMTKSFALRLTLFAICAASCHGWTNFSPFKSRSKTTTPNKPVQSRQTSTSRQRPVKKDLPPPPPPSNNPLSNLPSAQDLDILPEIDIPNPVAPSLWNSATASLIGFAANFAPKETTKSPERAARVTINRLPPQSFELDLTDVPIVGKALSGTYAKIKAPLGKKASVQVASPKDKLGAIQAASDTGKLQFGLDGLFQTNVDIELEPNQPGVVPIEVKSPLIPKLPFGKQKSDWNQVKNMGNGEIYYFNARTGDRQFEKPESL